MSAAASDACSSTHSALAFVSYTNVGIGKSGETPTETITFNFSKVFFEFQK